MGLTGRIKLNAFGFRTDFDLEIVELKNEGLRTMGFWNPTHEAQFYTQVNKRDIRNKKLIVSTILVGIISIKFFQIDFSFIECSFLYAQRN